MQSLPGTCRLTWLALFVALASVAPRVESAEPLRWKFTVGEKLDYKMVQEMNMTMTGAQPGGIGAQPGGIGTTMHQQMDMSWNVQGVNDDGEAVILQTFDRVQMKMNAVGQGFEYDSDSEAAPTGMAAMIAPLYEAMTKGEFEFTMTSRGEVKDVKIPEEVLAALKNSPAAATMGDMATAEGFQKMIMQGAMVLPENAPEAGEQWSSTIEMNNPVAGKQTVETSYTYDGTKDVEGTTYAVFRPALKMNFEGNEMLQMKVSDQSSEGEVLFNQEAGRLHSSNLKQKLSIDVSVAGQTLKQEIDQTIAVTVAPAKEEEEQVPESPSAAAPPAATESSEPAAPAEN